MTTTTAYDNPEAYIAGDRRRALASGSELPESVHGAALFADISGFTPLTEALVAELGAQRGAEQLSAILDELFAALLVHLHRHGGSVVYFSGDAVTCWLDGDDGSLATSCALAMQQAMETAGLIALPSGHDIRLAMKVAIAVGRARRFVVGDPLIQLIDVLAGGLMDSLADAEQEAGAGEIVLDETAARSLGDRVDGERRELHGRRLLRVRRLVDIPALPPAPETFEPLPEAVVRPWLLPAVYERLRTGRGEFLAELRTAVPLFLRFAGLDFDADPDAPAKLDSFVVAAQQIIDGYGGSTLQLTIGDKGAYLYAVFGAPLAHEDDTARACAAALELATLDGEHPVTGLQIGLGRGRVRSGTYGHALRRTFCCLGDAVNLAARLMAAAGPGEIYATDDVHQAAGPGYRWTRLVDRQVKGKVETVAAYALLGTDRRNTATRHRRHTMPLIGRDEQLAVLDRHIVATSDGKGQVVAITAGPGLGKSRLLVEAARLLGNRGIRTYEGEAQAFGTRASYGAWHDIWAGALDIATDATPEQQREHLHHRVAALDPSLASRVPLLGAALGLAIEDNELTASLTPKLRKASLEALLASLLQRLTAEVGPIAFLLEDCQWLDPLSVDLLQVLARSAAELPVLLLLASRDALNDPDDGQSDAVDPLRGLPHFVELALAELDEEACAEIVATKFAQLAGRGAVVPAALATMVLGRAEGNPFYLEELSSFIHGQPVDSADPAALAALDLPDSLNSLVLSRIDMLAEGPRTTVKVASVIGRQFRTPMLRGVHPDLGSADDVSGHLSALRGIGLIVLERGAGRAVDQTHLFKHVITAQAAYEATPLALRERLHEQVADYAERVEGTASGPQLDLLAYHYSRSANLAKTFDYLVRAGDRARADYANATAIDYYRRAAPLAPQQERTGVLLHLGGVLELTGDWSEAEQVYGTALELASSSEDQLAAHRARLALAEVARKQGRYEEAANLLHVAQAGFDRLGDRAGVGEVLHLAGTLAAQQGDYEQARQTYEASLLIRRELNDREGMGALFSNLGVIAEYTGDLDRAKELNEQALELRLELGLRWAIGVSQNNLGMIALLRNDYAEASMRFTEAMRLNTEVGDVWMVAIAHNNLGNATREQGQLETSAYHLGQALAAYRRHGDRWALAIVYEDIAALAVRRAEAEQALTLAGAADGLRAEIGSPRAPAQQESLDTALAPARSEVGDQVEAILARGRALEGDIAYALAEDACR